MGTVSLTLRFRILQRDNFTCQYCGARAPAVKLDVDHIDPRANGGANGVHNLITACYDCNRGKRDTLLSPPQVDQFSNRPVLAPEQPTRVKRVTVKRVLAHFFSRRVKPSIRDTAPVAKSFVYTGPDTFIPHFICATCGMLNTHEGDTCGCARRQERRDADLRYCLKCEETLAPADQAFCQECDDSQYCRGCREELKETEDRYCADCEREMFAEEARS